MARADAATALVEQIEAPGREGAAALLARLEPGLARVRGVAAEAIASGTPA